MANRYGALLLSVVAFAGGIAGCKDQNASAAAADQVRGPAPSAADQGIPAVLATIGGDTITMADVRARVGDNLDQMDAQYARARHKLVQNTLQAILRERVLVAEATKQNKTVDELVAAESGGSFDPSEVEISAWYQENQARLGGRSLDQIRPQIADLLRNERRKKVAEQLERRLNQERGVKINLEPYRVTISTDGAPALGPAGAPITLVEFSDFQCPFCGRFYPTLKRLEQQFGSKLRIVYKQYPIASLHPNATKAAEASLCSADQGKFWEMHDVMFQEQDRLAVRDLKAKAGRLGMNQKDFDRCLDTGRHTERVQNDLAEGSRLGITGTPALFINGTMLEGGAVAYDVVAAAVERELERVSR